MLLKRHRSTVELLPHDVVELILERLPVKPLLRFKSVSKKWKSTIESQRFQERQLILRKQSRGLDVLFVSIGKGKDDNGDDDPQRTTLVLGSSVISTVRFPTLMTGVCHGSCDGLVCLYSYRTPSFLVNPATRWRRCFPHSNIQHLVMDSFLKKKFDIPAPKLGLGRDKERGTYKAVFLYNSSEFGLDNVTTCEVFDFSTNAWRYVLPSSPYRILTYHMPVYLDGSLHWFTECEETKVLSFDLHTETFQVISKTPFAHVRDSRDVILSILENRLCVSEKSWPNQVIWSLDNSGGNKTWKKICSIDLTKTFSWLEVPDLDCALLPVSVLEKNKLILHGRHYLQPVLIHDLHTKSYDLLFTPTTGGSCVHYYESLFSPLPN